MKKYIYPMALAATLLTTTGCSDDDDVIQNIPDELKEKIQFSVGDEAKAASTNNAQTRVGFSAEKTKIVARFVSTDNTNTRYTLTTLKADKDAQANNKKYWTTSDVHYYADNGSDVRYWDDAFGRDANISVYAIAVPDIDDRASGYPTLFSLFNTFGGTPVGSTPWNTGNDDQKIAWSVEKTAQTNTTLAQEDLAYSNNISSSGTQGVYKYNFSDKKYPDYATEISTNNWTINTTDGQLMFRMEDGAPAGSPGKFDKGHLNFKHALSRLTIRLFAGKGFNMDQTTKPFDFKTNTNIDLYQMPQSGTFDIAAGNWVTASTTTDNIAKIYSSGKANVSESTKASVPVYELSAQVIPGYEFDSNVTTGYVMHFNIDDNDYYITSAQIHKALKDNAPGNTLDASAAKYTMEQGKNYLLNITVNKTEISNITATLVDWVEVAGSHTATNGYITLNLLDAGDSYTSACTNFNLYRLLNLSASLSTPTNPDFDNTDNTNQNKTGYDLTDYLSTEKTGDFTHNGTKWNSKWFFYNNYSFYHFRTVMPGTAVSTDDSNGDYFKMYSGPVNDTWTSSTATPISTAAADGKFNDYHWGATYDNTTGSTAGYLNYNDGFSHLSGPIGPYKNTDPDNDPTLNIIEQHMMANVIVVVETPKEGDPDYDARVQLYNSENDDNHKGSVITLTNLYPEATVRMGNGKVEPGGTLGDATITHPAWSTATDYFATANVKSNQYSYRVIPQELVRTTGNNKLVGITIQTPDNNVYYVIEDLSKIKVDGAPSGHVMKGDHTDESYIDHWYPGYTYIYTFKLKKTGIENITCTIVDWVTVTGANQDIDLES